MERERFEKEQKEKKASANPDKTGCCGDNSTHKTKVRGDHEYRELVSRLNRIEGQVRGVRSMVERNEYCVDILTQVAAIRAALNSFNKVLLVNHIKTCVADDIRAGKDAVIDELADTLQKLMK